MPKRRNPYFALAFALVGCGSRVQYAQLLPLPADAKPRAPEQVEVFTTRTPERPYLDVALIEARQKSSHSRDGTPELIAAMRAEAARHGCDALVIQGPQAFVKGDVNALDPDAGVNNARSLKGYRGTCVVYTADAASADGT